LLRMGWIANLLSHAVVSGLILASGILIAGSQLKHLLGIPIQGGTLPELVLSMARHARQSDPATLVLGLSVLTILLGLRRLGGRAARLGPLAVVLASVAVSAFWHLDRH